jgi:biopolymer transport protein ExbB
MDEQGIAAADKEGSRPVKQFDFGASRGRLWLLAAAACAVWVAAAMPCRAAAAKDDKPSSVEREKPAAAQGNERETGQKPEKNFLVWVVECSGFIGLVILVLSIYFVHTTAKLFWEMRVEVAAPPDLVRECENLLEQRDFKGVYAQVKDDGTFFGRLLTTGIAELPNGLAEARDAMERTGEAITSEMERKISMLAVLGTLGPMIGLLGTLKGMIGSFGAIARSSAGHLDASLVANKISEALLLTFEGVALSVPAIYFYAVFRNRVIHIATSVTLSADQFLRHFSHAGRSKSSAVAPAVKPPTLK